MRVYLDSSAILKRVLGETESPALDEEVRRRLGGSDILLSSALATIEVGRALRSRIDELGPVNAANLTDEALEGIAECGISEQVISLARRLGPPSLRSLDAIHLATASIVAADVVIAYDERLLQAASELGFRTASPGVAA